MSELKVQVREIESIDPHDNADNLEIARLEGTEYQSCVQIGEFEEGDLVAHIPPDSLVPEDIQEELGVEGLLAGPESNRVKNVRLRGVLSQGLLYPSKDEWEKGQNVKEELGIEKYEPPIPTQMDGQIWPASRDICVKYDVESYRNYPNVFSKGENVVYTEKIHGSFVQYALVEEERVTHELGHPFVVGSKGLLQDRKPFQIDTEYAERENANNVYLRAAEVHNIREKLREFRESIVFDNVFLLGEVFGKKIQDLDYGRDPTENDIGFQVFDIYVGPYMDGEFLAWKQVKDLCDDFGFEHVPELYSGPHSEDALKEHVSGPETVSGEEKHIREGVIIRPEYERSHDKLGRAILKAKSEDYLTRKGGTERH